MAFDTDDADDYLDLLDRVQTLALAEGWTAERETYDADTDTDGELILNGPGLDDQQAIMVGIRTYRDVGNDFYNWELRGMRDFNGEAWGSFTEQSSSRYLPLWNDTITYWLAVNPQRIAMVAKVSTVYMHMYLGFINSYAADFEHDYPLLIGGCGTTQNQRWSHSSVAAYWDVTVSGSNRGQIWTPDGNWQNIGNSSNSDAPIWPWEATTSALGNIRDSFGEYPLLPAIVHVNTNTRRGALGELDGVRYTTGFSLGTEDIIEVGAVDHLVAQNAYRNDIYNYCGLEKA